MKYRLEIDAEREEEVVIYAHKKTDFTDELCKFIEENQTELTAYDDRGIINLKMSEIYAFVIEDTRLYALSENNRYRLNGRLYQIEAMLDSEFVKINQSCIVNIKKIERFDTTIYGVLTVCMKNGFRDYVSRRQMRSVKERIRKKI